MFNKTFLQLIMRILVHTVLKILATCLLVYVSVVYIIDFIDTLVSDFGKIEISARGLNGNIYLLPAERNSLYYYQAASGNKFWTAVDIHNDSIKLNSVLPYSLILCCESAHETKYFKMTTNNSWTYNNISPLAEAPVSKTGYIIYQIIKSILMILAFAITFALIDMMVKKYKVYFKLNLIASFCFSLGFVGYLFQYFYYQIFASLF